MILLDVGPDVIPWQHKRGTNLHMGSERDNAQRPDLCRGGSTSFYCSTGFVQSPAVPPALGARCWPAGCMSSAPMKTGA